MTPPDIADCPLGLALRAERINGSRPSTIVDWACIPLGQFAAETTRRLAVKREPREAWNAEKIRSELEYPRRSKGSQRKGRPLSQEIRP